MYNELGFSSHDPGNHFLEGAFDSKVMSFKCSFAPAKPAILVGDLDQQPPRFYPKVLNFGDFGHFLFSLAIAIVYVKRR